MGGVFPGRRRRFEEAAGRVEWMGQGNTTTDHTVIRQWMDARGGRPSVVAGTDGEGILRVDFGATEDRLEEISWKAFLEAFEDRKLAFLHQDHRADGQPSRFFKVR